MMMTRPWTNALYPPHTTSYVGSNWSLGQHEGQCGSWTREENKLFEDALAAIDDTPDRWEKLAGLIPGKTAMDVFNHYRELLDDLSEIEAGRMTYPAGYGPSSPFEPEFDSTFGCEGLKQGYYGGERRAGGRSSDQERKKGIPWTEEEHKLFLLGLKKYGKGDWRNISRHFVTSRTPTQVASHAQKYFIRLNSGGKDKRRSSIHDITTENLPDNKILSSPRSSACTISTSASVPTLLGQFPVALDPTYSSEVNPFGLQVPNQISECVTAHGSTFCGPSLFQIQSSHLHSHV